MTRIRTRLIRTSSIVLTAVFSVAIAAETRPLESARLGRAKDHIADEQWSRAIVELRAAIADPRERAKDEALYWLAHSLNESGDSAAAVETILRLEREYPSSLWVKPAGSLRLAIAIRFGRADVLWATVVPPAPPVPPGRGSPLAIPTPPAPPGPVMPPTAPGAKAAPVPSPFPPPPPAAWLPERYQPDTDLRIQALGSLMRTDAQHAIPMLGQIALDSDPSDARRAIFVLAQSDRPEARQTVMQVAKLAPGPVRVAAVRELGRFGGPEVSQELLQVYSTGNASVKHQVVLSLGERAESRALLRIVESEKDAHLRDLAIVTLGRAGGREPLRLLYGRASAGTKRPIIIGLFNARADDDLIRIAEQERDQSLRAEVLLRLQLMGTPKARAYLEKVHWRR
jgi:hypothetical protein